MAKLDVRVYPYEGQEGDKTRAFASVTIEDLVAIKGIRVVEGTNGNFVAMPQSKDKQGNFHDIAFPVTGDLRKALNKAVLDEYLEVTKDAEVSPERPTEKSAEKSAEKSTAAPAKTTDDGPDLD